MTTPLEVCVDTIAGVHACANGGADRVELCAALDVGGLTPTLGLMQQSASCSVPIYAMIRPRAGDFCFSPTEVDIMLTDIQAAKDCGLAGVVLGAATATNRLDIDVLQTLCSAADGMGRTLHRVVDTLDDPLAAVDQAVELGFERILSSGQAKSALEGAPTLAKMRARAGGRISIMAGSGVSTVNAPEIIAATGVGEVHASCRAAFDVAARFVDLGFSTPAPRDTGAATVAEMQRVLAAVN